MISIEDKVQHTLRWDTIFVLFKEPISKQQTFLLQQQLNYRGPWQAIGEAFSQKFNSIDEWVDEDD